MHSALTHSSTWHTCAHAIIYVVMKYFGTDGIRGIVGTDLNRHLIVKIARGIAKFIHKHKLKKLVLIANDTRTSSHFISSIIESVLLEHGIEIHDVGEISSPGLAYLTHRYNYPLSIMISASHNLANYNGIKLFNHNGEKLSNTQEIEIERYMDSRITLHKSYAIKRYMHSLQTAYINHLRTILNTSTPAIFDCANGATSHIVKSLFNKSKKINCSPTGTNINQDSGCTHLDKLCMECSKQNMIGFAFDGDGDRVMMVDESGTIIDGDKLLFILSIFYLHIGDKLIGTIYSNEGLKQSLKQRNISLIRADVGDKNVYQKMCELGCDLGGEKSGHIIVKKYANTGDGILTAILILNILNHTQIPIKKLLENYQEFHQEYLNIRLDKISLNCYDNIIKNIDQENSRIIIRPSGTEPLLRIMVENKNKNTSKILIEKIKDTIMKQQKNE